MILNGTYKKILDAMPEGVFVFDDKLRVKFTNAAFDVLVRTARKGKVRLARCLAVMRTALAGKRRAVSFARFGG